jgi:hypothetical protein
MADQPSSLIARLIPKVTSILALLLSAWWVADRFVHPAYAVVWGVVMAIRSFRTEIGAWPEGPQKVHLPAEWQFALILGLFLATVITSPFLTCDRFSTNGASSSSQPCLFIKGGSPGPGSG